jgi:hypothetical protein
MSYSHTMPVKDPAAVLDYEIDWATNWLADGETISESEVVCDDPAITISGKTENDGVVRFTIAGGEAGANYLVTGEITTSAGRTDQRTVQIQVRNR